MEEDMMIEDGHMIVTCAKNHHHLNWCCLPVSHNDEGHHGEGWTGRGWGSHFSSLWGRPWMILFATMMTMIMIMTTITKMRVTKRRREWGSHFSSLSCLPWVITIWKRSPQISTVTDFEMETSNFVLFSLISIVSVPFWAIYDETIH